MNEHPDQLLADYVDGSLSPEDRTRVEAHVRDCPSCRQEIELATAARDALAALPDVDAPPGLTFEVRRRARRPRGGLAWKVATGAAAAAVLAAGIVVAVGPPGGGDATGGGADTEMGVDAAGEAPAGGPTETEREADDQATEREALAAASLEPRYRETDRDYDTTTIPAFGRRLRGEARASLRSGFPEPAPEFYRDFELDMFPDEARRAVECLLREAPPEELVVPYVVERASFQGEPAFVGAFLQGPAQDEPYDRVLLWVVERKECTLRYFATIRL